MSNNLEQKMDLSKAEKYHVSFIADNKSDIEVICSNIKDIGGLLAFYLSNTNGGETLLMAIRIDSIEKIDLILESDRGE